MPSARVVNHSGCVGHPRVVRRGLQREVERDLEAELAGPRDERVEVLERAEVGVDRVVAALGAADRPRRARCRPGRGSRVLLRPLRLTPADRVDRRQVDDVEAHRGDGVEALGGGARRCRTTDLARRRVDVGALGAREELVPGAVERALPVGEERVGPLGGDQLAQRVRGEHVVDLGRDRGAEPHRLRAGWCRADRGDARRAIVLAVRRSASAAAPRPARGPARPR